MAVEKIDVFIQEECGPNMITFLSCKQSGYSTVNPFTPKKCLICKTFFRNSNKVNGKVSWSTILSH